MLILFAVLMEAREHPFDDLRKKAFTTDVALPIAFERPYTWEDVKVTKNSHRGWKTSHFFHGLDLIAIGENAI